MSLPSDITSQGTTQVAKRKGFRFRVVLEWSFRRATALMIIALHMDNGANAGPQAEGDAFHEADSHRRGSAVVGLKIGGRAT